MLIVLTSWEFIDLLLRGGTIGILLLIALHLAIGEEPTPVTVIGVIFCLTGALECVLNAPLFVRMVDLPLLVTVPLQQIHFLSMWWFVLALFDDRFRWSLPCFLPLGLAAPLLAMAIAGDQTWSGIARVGLVAVNVGLLAMIIRIATRDRASDLVDERRAFRRALAFSVPPFTLLVSTINLLAMWEPQDPVLCSIYAAIYFLMALGFSYWLTQLKGNLFAQAPLPGLHATESEAALTAADRLELERIEKAVASGLFLEPGLTIGSLADRMHIPEHRVRRLINRGLGYRNFAAFVNDHRIAEAKRRLADPQMAREQIIQHAFSLGYASLAPFNRAFRERVGVSPTEYREEALTRAAAE